MPSTHRRAAALIAAAAFFSTLVSEPVWPERPDATPASGRLEDGAPAVESEALAIAEALEPPLRSLIVEALRANPGLRALEAKARAAFEVAPQVKSLPDPTLGVTAYLAPPETRVGPQRFMATFGQRLPATGKRALREEAALQRAAALGTRVETRRLALVTELRRLALELAFVDLHEGIVADFRQHLLQHEEIARARYSTGIGLGQAVVKIQAEITQVDGELLVLAQRRARLREEINELRDRPPGAVLPSLALEPVADREWDMAALLDLALSNRPELAAADAEIARADVLIELADKEARPDWTVGVIYSFVDRRGDPMGRLNPPPDDGDDVFGLQGALALPVRKARIEGARREAFELGEASWHDRRSLEARIRSEVGDLVARLPLLSSRLRLLRDLLVVQAEESLQSAQAAYVAGRLNALDLLDAEHVLFEARTAVARARADYLIALAELEGAVGKPLSGGDTKEMP